ncbi:MAG: hypothetical protein KY466_08895 [Gemmatimonadetes bacterium]|nr:hypothetical protein [Gemmatimonadota bacterium]
MITTTDHADAGGRLLPLWFAVLGPPVIWAARFVLNYALVPYTCAADAVLLLQLVTVVALLGVAWAGLVGWSRWRRAGRSTQVEFGGAEARARFMALVGVLGSGLFFAVIVAEALAIFFIPPCQTGGAPL